MPPTLIPALKVFRPEPPASFCAWCQRWFAAGQYLTPTPPAPENVPGDSPVSHSVCSPCMAGALAEGLANVKALAEQI
jgi:hypothetical protein